MRGFLCLVLWRVRRWRGEGGELEGRGGQPEEPRKRELKQRSPKQKGPYFRIPLSEVQEGEELEGAGWGEELEGPREQRSLGRGAQPEKPRQRSPGPGSQLDQTGASLLGLFSWGVQTWLLEYLG